MTTSPPLDATQAIEPPPPPSALPAAPLPRRPGAGPPHRRRHRRRRRRWLLALGALAVLGVATVAGAGAYAYRFYHSDPACDPAAQTRIRLGQTSLVLTAGGSVLGAVPAERHRQPVPLSRMSPWVQSAVVAVEDRRFFGHSGVDLKGILRAAWADVRAGRFVEGGSTISQQLARNLYGTGQGRSLTRKLHESCLALKLERRWSKREILAAYLNQVYLGAGAYGVEAAARTYFDRPAASLTLPQAALIAGMPQAPSGFDPFRFPERAAARRDDVLDAMLRADAITLPQWRWARGAPLGLVRGGLYTDSDDPAALRAVIDEVRALVGPEQAASGGLRIRTTIDPELQAQARAAVRAHLVAGDPAAAVVAIDPATGAVRALASVSNTGPLEFDLARQGRRQAGSAFKPFAFAAALRQRIDTSATYYLSSPLTYMTATGDEWKVENSEHSYGGGMSLDSALARSDNTVFARLSLDIGPAAVVEQARRLGITSPLAAVPSVALGVSPVSPLEMAAAYATLAAGGIRHRPTLLAEVRTPAGRVLRPVRRPGTRVLPAADAWRLAEVLQQVVERGTGRAAALPGRAVAGKTGTTNDFTDAWFVGYTPQLATAVWVGYPRRTASMEDVHGIPVYGGTFPARIWQAFMAEALAGRPAAAFPEPPDRPGWPDAPPRWRGYYQWRSSGDALEDAAALAEVRSARADTVREWIADAASRRPAAIPSRAHAGPTREHARDAVVAAGRTGPAARLSGRIRHDGRAGGRGGNGGPGLRRGDGASG